MGQATYFSAICVRIQDLVRVQVQIKDNSVLTGIDHEAQLIVDGIDRELSSLPTDTSTTIDGVSSGVLFRKSANSIALYFSTGLTLTITVANVSIGR